jgi:hypothetical protein
MLELEEVPLVLKPVVECMVYPSMTAQSSANIVFEMSLASFTAFHIELEGA